MDECAFIKHHLRPLAVAQEALGLQDDAALCHLDSHDRSLVLTCDTMVSGIHFLKHSDPQDVAHKILAVNASDLVVKGATPRYYLLSLACPEGQHEWLVKFCQGLHRGQETFGVSLLGGDTTATSLTTQGKRTVNPDAPMVITITMIGTLEQSHFVQRKGAQHGDWLVVAGDIGTAWVGLMLATQNINPDIVKPALRKAALDAYYCPRVSCAIAPLMSRWARASCDMSDGFAHSVHLLTDASHVGAMIQRTSLPYHPASQRLVRWGVVSEPELWTGGDDYIALFCVTDDDVISASKDFNAQNIPFHVIGTITQRHGVVVVADDHHHGDHHHGHSSHTLLPNTGYSHTV